MNTVIQLLGRLRKTNSSNDKKEILKEYVSNDLVKKVIYYTLNPFFKYGVSIENIQKYINNNEKKWIWVKYNDMFILLDQLKDRIITGHIAIESVIDFLDKESVSKSEKEILKMILNKDLESNVWTSLINKIFLNEHGKWLIPKFKVSLATKLEDVLKKWENNLDFDNKRYLASRKLDWIRTIAIFNDKGDNVKFYSRQWNEFLTLSIVKNNMLELLKKHPEIKDYVFDWETCIIKEDWLEDFKQIVWDIKKKDFTVENPRYLLFDMIKKEDFLDEKGWTPFIDRYNELSSLWIDDNYKNIKVLEHKQIDITWFNKMLELARTKWWEWLIIRNWDAIYEWKRTKEMIKVKDFKDSEFIVKKAVNWVMPILIDWKMIETEVLASVEIEYKWNIVNIWSWFTQEERLKFYKTPSEIIWKKITVKYFEETQDKNGKFSLRFPVYQWIRDYE